MFEITGLTKYFILFSAEQDGEGLDSKPSAQSPQPPGPHCW